MLTCDCRLRGLPENGTPYFDNGFDSRRVKWLLATMIKVLHQKDLMCTAGVHLMRRHNQPSTLPVHHSPFRMTASCWGFRDNGLTLQQPLGHAIGDVMAIAGEGSA